MGEFEQLYWQYLEVVASAQERCEMAVANLVRYDESGQDVPTEVLGEYAAAHDALRDIIAAYPRSQTRTVRLASTA
ncbi:MAG: hypothetical protein KJO55_09205 [Gammaproteobacteria bacterium]|nr:hypothetical protein [Gammaproteobacteria bacterium]NND61207.1 hypothetical protein [Gammaproteobacteria bacterium]